MDFARKKTDSLAILRASTDLVYLRNELKNTHSSMPDCAAESLYRTNKISILANRIKDLERNVTMCYNTDH
jgi:hypothetical protein